MLYLCKGYLASGKFFGPLYVSGTDKASAAAEYAGVVWRLKAGLVKSVDVEGELFTVGNSIEFYARPVAEAALAITR